MDEVLRNQRFYNYGTNKPSGTRSHYGDLSLDLAWEQRNIEQDAANDDRRRQYETKRWFLDKYHD